MNFILSKMAGFFAARLILLLGLFAVSAANAQEIYHLRSYHNSEKTRIVVDLKDKPNYATSLSANQAVMSLRVRNVATAAKAPASVGISAKSCVKSVQKRLDGKDVRYIFALKGCEVPKAFLLAPSRDSKLYRLVIDFKKQNASDLEASKSDSVAGPRVEPPRSTPAAAKNAKADEGVDISKPLSTLERDLFIKYSTTSKDGFRSMTPANASLYNQKLKQLRADYASAKAAAEAASKAKKAAAVSKTKVTQKKTAAVKHDVEELVSETEAPPVPVQAKPVSRPFIIAIDAGHGGKDPGAIGNRGVREKNVTLAISKALYSYINSNNKFRGTLIRSRDVFIDLDRRSEIARQRNADLLISIHADSVASGSSSARGASVLVLSENRALRENGKILRNHKQKQLIGVGEVMDQSTGNPYLATAILDMSSTNSRSEGNLLAKEILSSLAKFTKVRKSQPIKASLAVLKSPDIPSLLIETGYLSNRYEEIQLNQPNYQKQIAYRIYLGIKSYYEKYPAQKIKSRQESYARARNIVGKKSITVKKGESLSIIAKRYGTTVNAIKKLNSLKADTLNVGQVIYLP